MAKYAIVFLAAIGLIVVATALIIRGLVSGPSAPNLPPLSSYAYSATSVVFTIDSPVSAGQSHSDIIIAVNKAAATLRVTRGYDEQTVRTQTYPMSTNAYAVFLRALDLNGFTKGDTSPDARDERGQCALGDRFIYEVIDPSGTTIQHYWHTTCGDGTLQGNFAAIRHLFVDQIPDYDGLTADVNL